MGVGITPSSPCPRVRSWLEGARWPWAALPLSSPLPALGAQPDVQNWRGWGAAGSAAHAATTGLCCLPAACCNPVPLSSPPPDIDECAQGLHNCSQLCTNTPGAHACHCRLGFRPLDPAASQCLGEYLQAVGLAAHGAHPPAAARRSHAALGARTLLPGVPCCAHSPGPGQPKTRGAGWTDCGCAGVDGVRRHLPPDSLGDKRWQDHSCAAAGTGDAFVSQLHPDPELRPPMPPLSSALPDEPCTLGAALTLSPSFPDVDECQAQPGPCDHICHNSHGSFHCHHGFSLAAGGRCWHN